MTGAPQIRRPEAPAPAVAAIGRQRATAAAAEKLHLHRNTVRYRLRRVEELTGRSLAEPTGVAELHLALEAARIRRSSS
jgi:DNA-binding PucR family transcriptional regulator